MSNRRQQCHSSLLSAFRRRSGREPAFRLRSSMLRRKSERHFVRRRDAEQMRIHYPEIPRFRALHLCGIYVERIAIPCCRVRDCPAAIRKPAVVDEAAPVSDPLERGRGSPRGPAARDNMLPPTELFRLPARSSSVSPLRLSESAVSPRKFPEIDSSANARSRADSKRSSGFFSRQRRIIRSSTGGSAASSSGGSCFRIAFITSTRSPRRTRAFPIPSRTTRRPG